MKTENLQPITPIYGIFLLSPLIIFLILYLGISLIIEDFYKIPLTVALFVAVIWALFTFRSIPFTQRVERFVQEAGNSNVLYMVWIFILAGTFASLADKTGGVQATVALTMNQLPSWFVVPGIFIAACFISMAIGTSVGTVVALTPLAVTYAHQTGADIPFFVAVILGGAFFGDNLSFISDTTIAATRTQGCKMDEKFKANFKIVFPAALITLILYLFNDSTGYHIEQISDVNPWLVIPYLTVIVLALIGVNVTITLLSGIALSFLIAICEGIDIFNILGFMGDGIDSMGNLIIITLLAAGMLGLIKASGGIDFLMRQLTHRLNGKRGAKWAVASLVAIVNLSTANNTVAILTVGSISKDISQRYGIAPRQTASILDTSSCIVQCLIPYGAQTLLATTMAQINPTAPWQYLFYPWTLLVILSISMLIRRKKTEA